MSILTNLIVFLVALLHLYFLILEMFCWEKPIGLRIFALSPEVAKSSAVLAANQGLYNGFLAAGLIWSLFMPDAIHAQANQNFFLLCVILAGIYGALTVNKRIFFVQALPAILGLLLINLE